MSTKLYDNVWYGIEDDPLVAADLRTRSALMIAIEYRVNDLELSPRQASKLLGVTEPRWAELRMGRINLFSLEDLTEMARAAGLTVEHVR